MAEKKNLFESLFADESLSELSEDFKTKATVIFENAVAAQIAEEKQKLEEEYQTKLEEQRKEIETGLEEKVDSYLTYVAEEWMKENELAVENGIQTEIAENFLKGIKALFEESYVEIPKNKVDVVAEMTEELSKKSTALDEAIDKNIELKKEIVNMKKAHIVSECAGDLADTQMAKLNDLVEMIDYEDDEQFSGRIKSIVETYFSGKLNEEDMKKIGEEEDDDDEKDDDDMKDDDKKEKKEDMDESMKRYVEALSKSMRQ